MLVMFTQALIVLKETSNFIRFTNCSTFGTYCVKTTKTVSVNLFALEYSVALSHFTLVFTTGCCQNIAYILNKSHTKPSKDIVSLQLHFLATVHSGFRVRHRVGTSDLAPLYPPGLLPETILEQFRGLCAVFVLIMRTINSVHGRFGVVVDLLLFLRSFMFVYKLSSKLSEFVFRYYAV